MNIKLSFTILFFSFLTGCAATGEKFTGVVPFSDGFSTLYIYRESRFVGGGECPDMFLDNQDIGCLKNGGFMKVKVSPGNHILEVRKGFLESGNEPQIDFSSSAGEVIYIEWSNAVNSVIVSPVVAVSATQYLFRRTEEAAVKKLANLKES